MKFIYLLTLVLPMIGVPVFLSAFGKKHWKAVLTAFSAAELLLCILTAALPKTELVLFSFVGLDFTVAPDALGCIFSCVVAAMFFASAVFSTEYLAHDENPAEFATVFVLTLGAMLGLSWAKELQSYYMFFEFLTLVSFPLILHDRRPTAIDAARKYLGYSLMGAALVLFAFAYIFRLFGTTTFAAGGYTMPEEMKNLGLAAAFIAVFGFGCKAGMMPLHDWLPTAHPQAPASASAVLSGCVTKAGVLGIIRILYYVFGSASLRGTWVQTVLIAVALVTVFCGSMLAYKEKILKKRLAYSTVSQVSYALFGLFLMTEAGFIGAILQVVFHSVTKTCLFLCSGSIIHGTNIERIYSEDGKFNYTGLGKRMGLTMLGFTLASLSLVGLPPFGGFVSKWYLAEGSFNALGFSGWIGAAVLLASALMTAGYLISVSSKAFFPTKEASIADAHESGPAMTVPILALAITMAVLGVYNFGLGELLSSVAARLM